MAITASSPLLPSVNVSNHLDSQSNLSSPQMILVLLPRLSRTYVEAFNIWFDRTARGSHLHAAAPKSLGLWCTGCHNQLLFCIDSRECFHNLVVTLSHPTEKVKARALRLQSFRNHHSCLAHSKKTLHWDRNRWQAFSKLPPVQPASNMRHTYHQAPQTDHIPEVCLDARHSGNTRQNECQTQTCGVLSLCMATAVAEAVFLIPGEFCRNWRRRPSGQHKHLVTYPRAPI